MSDLKNRTRVCTAIRTDLVDNLKIINKETRVPSSRLYDEALEFLSEKYKDILDKYKAEHNE